MFKSKARAESRLVAQFEEDPRRLTNPDLVKVAEILLKKASWELKQGYAKRMRRVSLEALTPLEARREEVFERGNSYFNASGFMAQAAFAMRFSRDFDTAVKYYKNSYKLGEDAAGQFIQYRNMLAASGLDLHAQYLVNLDIIRVLNHASTMATNASDGWESKRLSGRAAIVGSSQRILSIEIDIASLAHPINTSHLDKLQKDLKAAQRDHDQLFESPSGTT